MLKTTVTALALSVALISTAQAGCMTGAAVGGVLGHVAGHHAVAGAAVGCAVGHHKAAKDKQVNQQSQDSQTTNH